MEVLEKPKTKKVWACPVVCAGVQDVKLGCGAKLRITEDDLFRVNVGNFGTSRLVAQFQCPECGARTDFFGYPEPAVLLDYREHQDYKPTSDLQGTKSKDGNPKSGCPTKRTSVTSAIGSTKTAT
jgi:hypothetical protein